jgi:hypothetical protein
MEGGQKQSSLDGLGNHVYLEKQDKLRDLGVYISTSQVRRCPDPEPILGASYVPCRSRLYCV